MSTQIQPVNGTKKEEFEQAVFEMLQLLDEKVTKLVNRFDRLAKELGYNV